MTPLTRIRPSPIAGLWYSDDPQRLRKSLGDLFAAVTLPDLPGEVVALIAPHAGHRYSGLTAAHAFRAVQGRTFDLVAVVSPMHQYHPSALMTSAHAAYATPLGSIDIDSTAVEQVNRALQSQGAGGLVPVAYDEEHSLEIELPFLQYALAQPFRLLPIMARTQSAEEAQQLGLALAAALQGRNALLVASTDLSHFYPEALANRLDSEMLHQIAAFSPDGVFQAEQSGQGFACGVAALGAVLWAARSLGADTVRVLHHSTSGDETGDHNSVVGYGAAVVLRPV